MFQCRVRLGIMRNRLHPFTPSLGISLAKPRLISQISCTHALHIASSMKAPESGASSATAAPAAEETPKAAVPPEAMSSGLAINRDLSPRSVFWLFAMSTWVIQSHSIAWFFSHSCKDSGRSFSLNVENMCVICVDFRNREIGPRLQKMCSTKKCQQ